MLEVPRNGTEAAMPIRARQALPKWAVLLGGAVVACALAFGIIAWAPWQRRNDPNPTERTNAALVTEPAKTDPRGPGLGGRPQPASQPPRRAELAAGTGLPFLMPEDFDHLDLVAWRVEPGRPDPKNPLLEPGTPWDGGTVMSQGTVLRDPIDGLWKAWHTCWPVSKPRDANLWVFDERIAYLESKDGVHWERPALMHVPWQGKPSNLVIDAGAAYASVNVNPRREFPYEMFVFREPGNAGTPDVIPGLALPPGEKKHSSGLYRYRSKDGKKWEAADGPLKLETSDSCFVYALGQAGYVTYHKTQLPAPPGALMPVDIADGNVRLIGRRVSKDGVTWSDPTSLVMTPDWRDPADTQFMELCPVAVPGGYMATLTVYHTHTQTIDLQLAGSRDGINWWRPDRRPALPNAPLGDYGGGEIWPFQAPVLEDQRLHVYYSGSQGLHGDLYNTRNAGDRRLRARGEVISRQSSSLAEYGALCRATWTADRLWAMTSASGGPYVGTAITKRAELAGKKLLVNAVSRADGELRVELLDDKNLGVPGFGEVDCEPIRLDQHAATVKWKGGERAPANATKTRFHLKSAYLYGFEWRD